MNIFVTDESPWLSAIHQHDRHVVKMIIESLQLLSTACHLDARFGGYVEKHHESQLYAPISNPGHASAIWTRATPANFVWVTVHASGLMHEYHRRFRKYHAAYPTLLAMTGVACKLSGVERFWMKDANRNLIIDPKILEVAATHTPFVYCGPEDYKVPSVIESYRRYYLAEKLFTRANQANRWSIDPSVVLPGWLAEHANRYDRWATSERVVAKPRVPQGFAIPSFLRNLVK